jgi:hypothetical protein
LEELFKACDGSQADKQKPPFDAVKPGSYEFPKGDSAKVEYYDDKNNDKCFGYLKVTIDGKKHTLTFEFMGIKNGTTKKLDEKTINY